MSIGDQQKALLFNTWLKDHQEGNVFSLFSSPAPTYELTVGAKAFFARPVEEGLHLYMLLVKSEDGLTPLYIGKASSPRDRWMKGHLSNLRKAVGALKPTSYSKWIKILERAEGEAYLFCIHESAIKYPPIPGFPKTVGSIEYQLVSLAGDAFPGVLLNSEGVGR
jgi:hypothetical protein